MSSEKYKGLDPGRSKTQDLAVPHAEPEEGLVRIDSLAAGGRGVGRVSGRVWLVEGAVPGDLVRASAVRIRKSLVEARSLEILGPSPGRRPPPCPIQGQCGGCPWMVLDEAEQRTWKRRLVTDGLERIGKLQGVEVAETVPSDRDLGYRNKVELTFGREGERRLLGFHPPRDVRKIVDVEECLLQGRTGARILASAREFFLEGEGKGEPALDVPGEPTRLIVRESRETGTVLVALRGAPGPFRSAEAFAHYLASRHPEVKGVVRILSRPGRRGGATTVTLLGEPFLEETLGGTRFRLPAGAFFQVNTGAAERLVDLVLEAAGVSALGEVLDLYGGVGVFGLALARRGARVTAVEADHSAVECGRRAAAEAGVQGVEFVLSEVAEFLRSPATGSRHPDVVVADPPRTGLGRGVAEAIARLGPERIVLVSCDAPTLGRDLRALADRAYAPRRVVPVDLFPQTAHVEAVAVAERID
jgi:23S rRNA (uracil1939-C5)-methyltransferase